MKIQWSYEDDSPCQSMPGMLQASKLGGVRQNLASPALLDERLVLLEENDAILKHMVLLCYFTLDI